MRKTHTPDEINHCAAIIIEAAEDMGFDVARSMYRTPTAYLTIWNDDMRITVRIGDNHGKRRVDFDLRPRRDGAVQGFLNELPLWIVRSIGRGSVPR